MLSFSVLGRLLLAVLVLALSNKINSAPTHHLTIGVQGNTPTLMVTSSEVGITSQTMGSTKKSTKSLKDLEMPKKSTKTKFNKSHILANKNNKMEYVAKHLTKKEESSNKKIILEKKEDLSKNSNKTMLLRGQGISTVKLETLETTTSKPPLQTTAESVEISETNLQFTALTPKHINEMPFILSVTPQTTSKSPEEISTLSPQVTSDTSSISFTISDNDNLNIFPAVSTTLSPEDFEIVTAINNNDDKNTVTTTHTSRQTQTETNANDVVLQTQKTTEISANTSIIKMAHEDDSDRYTQGSKATRENENLLLTTTQANAFTTATTPAAISTPTLFTSTTTENVEATTATEMLALSLTMTTTTTENLAADDNNNNNRDAHGPLNDTFRKDIIAEEESEILSYAEKEKDSAVLKSRKEYTTTPTVTQQSISEIKSSANPVKETQTFLEPTVSATESKFLQNKIETITIADTATTTVQPTLSKKRDQQKGFTTFNTSQQYKEPITTTPPDQIQEFSATATTEMILKLIDLEKHDSKPIDELEQPSLLMTGQHDNGHDGLKKIKKKQLVDKHYVEALLHNKQDFHIKDVAENERFATHKTHRIEETTSQSAGTGSGIKTTLMPKEHGFLGPILMQEKSFHVIHHDDNDMKAKNHHNEDINSHLKKGNFVELKARQAKDDNEKHKEIESSLTEAEQTFQMQSDQPVHNLSEQNKETVDQHNEENYSVKEKQISKNAPLKCLETENCTKTSSMEADIKFIPDKNIENDHASKQAKEVFEAKKDAKLLQTSSDKVPLLSATVFQVNNTDITKTPIVQAEALLTSNGKEEPSSPTKKGAAKQQTESKISDIQIEVYDSTVDSIVSSTNFKSNESKHQNLETKDDEVYLGKTTKPPIASIQQERFTQYVIDRTETSTQEPINYNTIQVASGKPEPAAIEIHINVSESFGGDSEDLEFAYPQTEYNNNRRQEKADEELYDDSRLTDNIKLKIPANSNGSGKELRNDEILVVEIIDTDNNTGISLKDRTKSTDELFITDVKNIYSTPPPPPPPPPFQTNFDRDSDTIFYISNTEVKVGESLPSNKKTSEDRKLRLESQFFPANYIASTHPNVNNADDTNPIHHLYEEDIILSSSRNQADSLKIYRNANEPSPPLDVTYVGESIIEVEQSPGTAITTTYAPEQTHNVATQQADVIIQPAILPEISIGVPVIGELPPQIELKEIDFMPNEAQLHRSGIYDDNDNSNNNDIDDNTITGGNNHDIDIVGGNSNSNQRIEESSIQYGGDLIDESADGGFDGVEGSYPFGNPAAVGKSSSSSSSYTSGFLTKFQKQQTQQQPNHLADYAHLYVNYGVNNMRKDELSADVKDSGEMLLLGNGGGGSGSSNINVAGNEQNQTSFKEFLSKVSMSNSTTPFTSTNATQSERMSNATAFSVMEDANDLEDKNTENIINLISLAIGLFIVILPVVVTCSMFWALRYLYKKYHSNLMDSGGYADQIERKVPLDGDGAEKGEFVHVTSSSPTNSHKETIETYPETSNKPSTADNNVKFSSHKSISHIETSSSNTNATTANNSSASASRKNEALQISLALSSPNTQKQIKTSPSASSPFSNHTTSEHKHNDHDDIVSEERDDGDIEMPGPNGSVTKMTLENNLLIVETEERNDISRVARETKMDYNKDGVFVVEVARGIDSKTIPESPVTDGNEKLLSMFETKQNNGGLGYKITNEKNYCNNEQVQIHSPPAENQDEGPRSLHQIEEVEEPINSPIPNEDDDEKAVDSVQRANTGLSQSDLSTTSSSDSNKGYCYGNQELYVVEQKGYSTVSPTGNVVVKCDLKDIKDDDRNPENDHYLEHSPDKKEDSSKDKEHIIENPKKLEGEGSRTCSGESPEQKQNDKVPKKEQNGLIIENHILLQEKNVLNSGLIEEKVISRLQEENIKILAPCESTAEIDDITQPCDKETSAEIEGSSENKIISSNDDVVENDLCVLAETISVPQILTPENISKDEEDSLLVGPSPESGSAVENCETDEVAISTEAIKVTVNEDSNKYEENKDNFESLNAKHMEEISIKCKPLANICEITNGQLDDNKVDTVQEIEQNGLNDTLLSSSEINEEHETEDIIPIDILPNKAINNKTELLKDDLQNAKEDAKTTESFNGKTEPEILQSSTHTLLEIATESKQKLQNGHADIEHNSSSSNETENGYDSILSLPEPPPTTDEPLNSDLSDQQLDSLPPPPPPEIFSLKDLPPPLTNGTADSPQSEESTNFYHTLPPPPPTTLEVTVATETTTNSNGKVHASPLTPPASPPPHFANNIHAGLCSQPIAVDVNGS